MNVERRTENAITSEKGGIANILASIVVVVVYVQRKSSLCVHQQKVKSCENLGELARNAKKKNFVVANKKQIIYFNVKELKYLFLEIYIISMAQNVNPDQSHSSNLSKQSDETCTVKDNHAVSKR